MRLLVFGLMCIFLLGLASASTQFQDLGNATTDSNQNSLGIFTYSSFYFTAASNFTLDTVQIYISEAVSPRGNLNVIIAGANSSRAPNTTVFGGTSESVTMSSLTTGAYHNITWIFNKPDIVEGGNYTIVFNASEPSTPANDHFIRIGETSGTPTITHFSNSTLANAGNGGVTVQSANIKLFGIPSSFVKLGVPDNTANLYNTTTKFNATITGGVNGTLYIWNASNDAIIQNFSLTPSWNISTPAPGNYTWNVLGCTATECNYDSSNRTFKSGAHSLSNIYNSSTFETAFESFTSNISVLPSATLSNIDLWYDGVKYVKSVSTSDNFLVSHTQDTPTSTGSKNWFWSLTYSNGFQQNLSSNTQTVNQALLYICNSTGVRYINLTFQDETNNTRLNTTIDSSTWNYYLGTGTTNKTLTYSNATNNLEYGFCFTPQDRTVNTAVNLKYSATDYPQRTWNPINKLSLTNSSTNYILFLLNTNDGLYVTFQVINLALQPIDGVYINISRSDLSGIIESRVTDSAGAATFWLNSNFAHSLNVNKSGYPLFTTTLTPTQSTYTITLGDTSSSSNITDTYRGITTNYVPSATYLANNTIYNFNFTIDSNYWGFDLWGYRIWNSSGSILNSTNSTVITGGTLGSFLNTENNSLLIMQSYWSVNGTISYQNRTWVVFNDANTQWSIKNFVTTLDTYLTGDGLFGLKKGFSLNLIIFLVIFGTTGVFSWKFGFTSPIAILGMIFGMTLLFDVGLGLIQNPSIVGDFPAATFMMFLLLIGAVIKEGYR